MTLFSGLLTGFGASFWTYWGNRAPDYLGRLVVALLILVGARAAGLMAGKVVRRVLSRDQDTLTLAPVVGSLARLSISGGGIVMALAQVGIDVTTVLAGAGVLGLAVGFGAQALVKDLISGFFLIFDGVIRVGDAVKMDAVEGVVEAVGLRMTRVRALNGRVWYVPNGAITIVGNLSRDWTRAVVEVGVGYGSDVARALHLMQAEAESYLLEKGWTASEPPKAEGVLSLDDSSVKLRLLMKTPVGQNWEAELELRRRVKAAFEKNGVDIPYPSRVVYHRQEGQRDGRVLDTVGGAP